ncbi:hypothetical protein HDU91_005825 [Kappamyces sp. JEL0680]|nr:hypothetical protein HDU91_005825 [Kappamyces sp. JEL0680]
MTVNSIQEFPNEIILNVFSYLRTAQELVRVGTVCRQWHKVAGENVLWRALCAQRWKDKQGMTLELHYRADYTDIHHTLSIKEIKEILRKRSVYMKGLLERSEFVELLLKTTPATTKGRWAPKWKAAYITAELDSKRTEITKDELCSRHWKLRFNNWPDHQASVNVRFCAPALTHSGETSPKKAMHGRPEVELCPCIPIQQFPNEIILNVFSYLRTAQELVRVGTVCRQWHKVAGENVLWRALWYHGRWLTA